MPDNICKLDPTPENPDCSFKAKPDDVVTVEIQDKVGAVRIMVARYNGADLPGTPSKTVTFTVVAGSHDLEVTYGFSDPVNGRGELHEVCDANPFLMNVRASSPVVAYTICA